MSETKWFKNERERIAYIRGQYSEFKPKVVKEKGKNKKGCKKK